MGRMVTEKELREDLKRNESGKNPRPCRKCEISFNPGDWNFYDLCDSCFVQFNKQKMTGRFWGGEYYESSTEWIKGETLKSFGGEK